MHASEGGDICTPFSTASIRKLAPRDPSLAYDPSGALHLAYREGTRPVYLAKSGGSWVTRHLAPRAVMRAVKGAVRRL